MSYGVHSDEVAEDYSRALEELTLNSRYEISNLTVIARENTEHALAISQALKDHIKRVGLRNFFSYFSIAVFHQFRLLFCGASKCSKPFKSSK